MSPVLASVDWVLLFTGIGLVGPVVHRALGVEPDRPGTGTATSTATPEAGPGPRPRAGL